MATNSLIIDRDALLDIYNISSGTFYPLRGFLTAKDYHRVVNDMHLVTGEPWVMPITLDLPQGMVSGFLKADKIYLRDSLGKSVAILYVEDIFKINFAADIKKVYGTSSVKHPGVKKELSRSKFRIGGKIKALSIDLDNLGGHVYSPEETKRIFKKKKWKTIVGFQTRNPIHRAHEYLQRSAICKADGLYINPLVGWKKDGDFSSKAIIKSYKFMIDNFYPKDRVFFGILRTAMRYAGPREAVFHAQIRKNYGCTHFIIGRDHAGVGNYYGKYAAHKICDEFDDLGIEILKMPGPFYCKLCADIATEEICKHKKSARIEISGTLIRKMIKKGKYPPEEMVRREIAKLLLELQKSGEAFYEELDS